MISLVENQSIPIMISISIKGKQTRSITKGFPSTKMGQFKQVWEVETFPHVGIETNRSKGKENKGKFNFLKQSKYIKECIVPDSNNAIKRAFLRKHVPLIMSRD